MKSSADIAANHALELGFQLGNLQVDPQADEVTGPGGRARLDPKVMDVLVLLAQHAGHVVLREDLLAQLWPNVVVTEDALSRCIYELRRHLSHAGGDESYKTMLETLPKRGYRMNGEVVPARKPAGSASGFWPLRRVAAMAAAILIAVLLWFTMGQRVFGPATEPPPLSADDAMPSIAVLPFMDMSAGQDQGFLSDGVSEEIINRLAQIPALRVIARTSSFSFRGESLNISEIVAKLNVTHVLEGSVRRSGDHVRITAQLIEATSNSHLWSETFNRELGDLFAVQDEIAAAVAGALQIQLADAKHSGSALVTAQAHEQFLQGQFFYNRRAPGDIERSAKYYEEAVAIDPGYARAWAALSGAYSLLAWDGETLDKDLQVRQGEAALKAVELDPRLAVAHARLSRFYYNTRNYEKAVEHEREAATLDPNDLLVLGAAGSDAVELGDFDKAIALQRQAVALDPLASMQRLNLAVVLFADGQLDEAMSEFRKTLELNPDAGSKVEIEIARVLVLQRHYDAARAAIAQLPDGKYRDHGLALLYRAPGRLADADLALKRLVAQRKDIMDSVQLAEVYAFRGMSDEAFSSLQREKNALEHAKNLVRPRLWDFYHELLLSPFLKPLHDDPRWKALAVAPS